LRIQLLDEERLPMFATGSSAPNDRARLLLTKVAPVLARLPEDIAMIGHTDATPYVGGGKTNWELSTERANATRRLLTDAGLAESRVTRVTGLADRDPLLPADPFAAENRRIAIIVLNEKPRTAVPTGQPSGVSPVLPASPGGTATTTSGTTTSGAPPVAPTPLTSPQSPAMQMPSGQPQPGQIPANRFPSGPSGQLPQSGRLPQVTKLPQATQPPQSAQPLVESPVGLPPPVLPPAAQSPPSRAAVQPRGGALPPASTPAGAAQSASTPSPRVQPPVERTPLDDPPSDAPFANAPFSKPPFAPPNGQASQSLPP
jgi:hypothetical protein